MCVAQLVIDADLVDWITAVMAFGSLLLAIFALYQTGQSNRTAREANELARDANTLSERTTRLQEDESRVRLVVKPRIVCVAGETGRPHAMVEVINLSSFPVIITGIHWKNVDGTGFYWKNPDIANPFGSLPARLPPRECLTAMGNQVYPTDEQLLQISHAVVITACGEEILGMTDQFREHVAKIRAGEKVECGRDVLKGTED